MMKDWYEHRHELKSGMIFNSDIGKIQLDRRVPGDGTQWYVAIWWGDSWAWMDTIIEPGDLKEQLYGEEMA